MDSVAYSHLIDYEQEARTFQLVVVDIVRALSTALVANCPILVSELRNNHEANEALWVFRRYRCAKETLNDKS